MKFDPLHTDSFVQALRREHPLATRKTLAWPELESERLIAVARSSGNRQLLDDALAKAGINPSYRFEVSHIATLLGMVEAGLGLAAVPRLALPPAHPALVGIALRRPSVSRVLGLATRRGAAPARAGEHVPRLPARRAQSTALSASACCPGCSGCLAGVSDAPG
ncbi:LysR substrate-binding domain-containing protein [Polaromonas sp. P1(28)-8]|nr:LysR substrate-binding domain-containing protein [Polaromonas sp. P1(28)-8]